MSKIKKGVAIEWIIIVVLSICAIGGIYMNAKAISDDTRAIIEDTKIVLYEGPKSLRDATEDDLKQVTENQRDLALMHCTDTQIKVNGYDCYVYDTNVNHIRQWMPNFFPPQSRTPVTYFDFEGMVEIEVAALNKDIDTVKISPLSYGIVPELNKEKGTVTFTVTEPDMYTIEFNDAPERAVHIFANSLETDIPDKDDENVIYIGPGEWDIETITLTDNQTLYIAGGAVVHGVVNANYAKNITVKGRGIIDGSTFKGWQGKQANIPLKFDHCQNVNIEDIIILNSNAWVCQAFNSKDGVIDGIKIISSRPNGDGITLQSCTNYTVQNCFVRSWDDSLVVKNYYGSSSNIKFFNMQLWTDLAQSMEIGFETNKANRDDVYIKDIVFEDITVLNNFHKPVISIHNGDNAIVSDIIFKNIVVENAQMGEGDGYEMAYLIDLLITQSSDWSTTKERGYIRNIEIENVEVLSGKLCPSRIDGYDQEHKVENVLIRNLTVLGEKITSFAKKHFEIDVASTSDITIE